MINIRMLAALDIAFLGSRVILSEFAFGVLGPMALGILTCLRSHTLYGVAFGLYLMCLGVNYVPLLLHGIDIVRRRTAQVEVSAEPGDRRAVFRKYRRGSVLLLVPLVVPALAIAQ